MITFALASLLTVLDPTPAAAGPTPPAPTADEIKKVAAYYLNGAAAGPILMDLIPCKKAGRNADGKLTCDEPIEGGKAKKGDVLIAFTRFFVPKGGKYNDLKIRFLLDGNARTTADFTLEESSLAGYANYHQTTASKVGTWEMQVMRGDNVIASAKIAVTE